VLHFILDTAPYACAETIYKAIYTHPRGERKSELIALLRQGRNRRRPRTRAKDRRGIADMTGIKLRPPEVDERVIPGHFYFCDPHSPWQKGSCENMNGLLRQYLPRGGDLSDYSQQQPDTIADRLNNRPRQILDWNTPHQVFESFLHTCAQ